jgi:hypothetical protein
MATLQQVAAGVAHYYDVVVRPSISGAKGIVYGVAVGMAAAHPERIVGKYLPTLQALGIMSEDGNIDVGAVAVQLKEQIAKAGGRMTIQIGQDSMSFTPEDVDRLIELIDRVKA